MLMVSSELAFYLIWKGTEVTYIYSNWYVFPICGYNWDDEQVKQLLYTFSLQKVKLKAMNQLKYEVKYLYNIIRFLSIIYFFLMWYTLFLVLNILLLDLLVTLSHSSLHSFPVR